MPSPIVARDLIESSMRLLGVLANGEAATGDEIQDGLNSLNDVIEQLSLEGLVCYGSTLDIYPAVIGQQVYTVGPSGDFNQARPVRINDVFVRLNGVDYPLQQVDFSTYNSLPVKTNQGIPEWYAYVNDDPLGRIYVYPVVSQAMNFHMDTQTILESVPDPTTLIGVPLGYAKMLRYLLALDMYPEYPVRTDINAIREIAMESKGNVKRANLQPPLTSFDRAITLPYGNIYQGWY